jgi:hypothetical protein
VQWVDDTGACLPALILRFGLHDKRKMEVGCPGASGAEGPWNWAKVRRFGPRTDRFDHSLFFSISIFLSYFRSNSNQV